jgi:cytoskeleton protein RodZ
VDRPREGLPHPILEVMLSEPASTPGALIDAALRQCHLTLDDLSQSTRLRLGLLHQMLDDDFAETGGDTYARGHLRVIARVLNLDPDMLLESYDSASQVRRPPTP